MVYLDRTGKITALVVPGRSSSAVALHYYQGEVDVEGSEQIQFGRCSPLLPRRGRRGGIRPLLVDEADTPFCWYMVQNTKRGREVCARVG